MAQFKYSKCVPADSTGAVGAVLQTAADPRIISFVGGLPAPELSPAKEMKATVDKVFKEHGREATQYGAAKGITASYEVIQQHVKEKESVDSELDNVLITTGSKQALDLVGKTFVDPGDTVLVKQPTCLCALDVFRSYGANFASTEMDEGGMKMGALEEVLKTNPDTRLVYTMPNFQNPTGRTMAEEQRRQLAELAEKYGVYVLEDNPYGEVRFAGQHVPAAKSFDRSGHVLCMGTFSKTLASGFRLGWLVADEDVVNKLTVLEQSADLHADNLTQFAVAQFFTSNDVDTHVKEISGSYDKRKDLMFEGIKKYFPEGVKYTNPEDGMFLWVEIPGVDDTVELFKECLEHDVAFVPGDPFFAGEAQPGAFHLNYSNMKEDQIEVGLKRLGATLAAIVNK